MIKMSILFQWLQKIKMYADFFAIKSK